MKVVTLDENNVVKAVYPNILNPTIYPDAPRIVHEDGSIEDGLEEGYILLNDHEFAVPGMIADEETLKRDVSHHYISMDFHSFRDKVEDFVDDTVENVKDFFTKDKDKDGDNHDKG